MGFINNVKGMFNFGSDSKKFVTEEGKEVEIDVTPLEFLSSGQLFPPIEHRERIDRYKRNKKVFKGQHFEVFKDFKGSKRQNELLYISINLAGIVCKKSADFLFGEALQINAGNGDNSKEQLAFNRFYEENNLNILTYESALGNAYRGDSFVKVRYGQEFGGELPKELDPARVIIEPVNPETIFPETSLYNRNKIIAYHIAVPVEVTIDGRNAWQLFVESHYTGRIEYRVFNINPLTYEQRGSYSEVTTWKIENEVVDARSIVPTGIAMPLVVHIPNYGTDDTWEGLDDVTEHLPILDEINNRLTQISDILDKHADPAMAVPSGIMGEDQEGNPEFNVRRDKVFEVMGKDDVIPQYVTWEGQLSHAFSELDRLVELFLTTSEIPGVALGKSDSGTSGASGLSIKWRMNSLLAKINRKRQYYEKGLKQVVFLAQALESVVGKADYKLTIPKFVFKEGLPKDETEEATVMSIRTGGMKTLSQKTAIMRMEGMTEEQAELELERIKEEEANAAQFADPSIFNEDQGAKDRLKNADKHDTSKHAEGNPKSDEAIVGEE